METERPEGILRPLISVLSLGICEVMVMWGMKVGEDLRDGWVIGRLLMSFARWSLIGALGGGVSQSERTMAYVLLSVYSTRPRKIPNTLPLTQRKLGGQQFAVFP